MEANCVTVGIVVRVHKNPCVIVKPPLSFQTHDSWCAGWYFFTFLPFSLFSFLRYFVYIYIFLSFLCLFLPSILFVSLPFVWRICLFLPSPYLRVYLTFLPCFLYIFLFKPCLCFFLGRGVRVSWAVAAVAGYSLNASLLTCVHFPFCSAFWGQKLSFYWYRHTSYLRAGEKEVPTVQNEVLYHEDAWWSGGIISWILEIGIRWKRILRVRVHTLIRRGVATYK